MAKLLFMLVFSLSCVFGQAKPKNFEWTELRIQNTDVQRVIGGKSINDFWFINSSDDLLRYKNNRIVERFVFDKQKPRNVNYYFINNKIISLSVDFNWSTTLRIFTDKRYKDYGIVSNSPIYLANKYGDKIILAGDFGKVLLVNDKTIRTIKNSITGHISAILNRKCGSVILSVNNGDVLEYKDDGFSKIGYDGNLSDWLIGFYENTNGELIAKSIKNDLYILKDNKFIKFTKDSFFPDYFTEDYNFSAKFYNEILGEEVWIDLTSIPPVVGLNIFSNGKYCVSTLDGRIFSTLQESSPLFTDETRQMGILLEKPYPRIFRQNLYNGIVYPETERNMYVINIFDMNNDNQLDFILSRGKIPSKPLIYQSSMKGQFVEYQNLGLYQHKFFGVFFQSIDLNNDSEPEFVTNELLNSQYIYKVFSVENNSINTAELFKLPADESSKQYQHNLFYDFDQDGLLDLFVALRYGAEGNKGKLLFYKNYGNYEFGYVKTDWEELTTGWNQQIICADIDNNGFDDIFLLNNWSNDLIILNEGKSFKYKSLIYNEDYKNQRKAKVQFVDYDNDGDLDIFVLITSIRLLLYSNDGKGNFINESDKISCSIANPIHFTCADFNNDSYADILISGKNNDEEKTNLLVNKKGKTFSSGKQSLGISDKLINVFEAADIDNDGDLDIVGNNDYRNYIIKNTINNNRYLKIKLNGMDANSEAIGSKVWIYDQSSVEDEKLIGYRQKGSCEYTTYSFNSSPMHFGIENASKVKIKVQFPGGNIREIENIKIPAFITINEFGGLKGKLYFTWQRVKYFFAKIILQREFLFFIIIIAFTIIAVILGEIYFGWRRKIQIIIFLISLVIYWVLSNSFLLHGKILNFIIPVLIQSAFLTIPFLYNFWLNTNFSKKTISEKNDELYNLIMNFAHGQWAASNLISLQTLSSNYYLMEGDSEFELTLKSRKETYVKTVKPLLTQILELRNLISSNVINKNSFLKTFDSVNDLVEDKNCDYDKLTGEIENLRKSLSRMRINQINKFAVDPADIIQKVKNEYNTKLEENKINFNLFSESDSQTKAVIKAHDLAFIIDNCISNSIKALKNQQQQREITFVIKKSEINIILEVNDNGCGIENANLIFEKGYSNLGGTGMGLYESIERLKKYNGKMYLESSKPFEKTVFKIELQKVN